MNRSFPTGQSFVFVLFLGLLGGQAMAVPYDNKLANNYYAQTTGTWCGAATAQMILDSTAVGNIVVSQSALFTQIQANNGTVAAQGNYYTSPKGLRDTLAARDVAHTYVAYNIANVNAANRTLAYNLDHYGVPGGALVNAGAHWINVRGVNTNIKPGLANGFTINGFYVRDPSNGFNGVGLGRDRYIRNDAAGWQASFTPTNYGGAPQGKYSFVTDPDDDTEVTNSSPTAGTTAVPDLATALSVAATDVAAISGLATDLSFENGAFGSTGGESITMPGGSQSWVVPYYQTGNPDPSGVAFVNAATGDLEQAFWDEGILAGDSLATFENNLAVAEEVVVTNVAPEPSTFVLLGAGVVAFAFRKAVNRRKSV